MSAINVEQAIYYLLKNSSSITALCPDTSIYYLKGPENASYPIITYQRISTTLKDLTITGTNGIAMANIQIATFDTTLSSAKQIANKIMQLLHGYKGTVDNFQILEIKQVNEFDSYEYENFVYQCYQSFNVYYVESLT